MAMRAVLSIYLPALGELRSVAGSDRGTDVQPGGSGPSTGHWCFFRFSCFLSDRALGHGASRRPMGRDGQAGCASGGSGSGRSRLVLGRMRVRKSTRRKASEQLWGWAEGGGGLSERRREWERGREPVCVA